MSNRIASAMLALSLATGPAPADPAALTRLLDERAIIQAADSIDRAVDAKDWPAARTHLADSVAVDFTSLIGGAPAVIQADALIQGWAANLGPRKTSLHLRTNHQATITGDAAVLISHGYAWNRMEGNGDPLWEVWGVYEHRLQRSAAEWKVTGFTFRMTHERGNLWVKTTPSGR